MKSDSQTTTTSQDSSNINIRAAIVSSDNLQVAAIFDTTDEAKTALRRVEEETTVASHQSEVIEPSDPRLSEKLEQKSSSIANTLWTSHIALSGIGFALGMVAAFLLTQYGPALTQQNPLFTYIALISPGTFIGMFVAGLIALRPDRNEIVSNVTNASRNGKSALIINLRKTQSAKMISRLLQQQSSNVVQSIK